MASETPFPTFPWPRGRTPKRQNVNISRTSPFIHEVPGANGQGETVEEAKQSLKEAVALLMEDRLEDIRRGLPDDAIQETIAIS